MRRLFITLGVIALLAPALEIQVPVETAPQTGKVTICHRTGSDGNPFTVNTTDNQAIINAHVGAIAHPPRDGRVDLILPFPNGTKDDCEEADVPPDVPGDDPPTDIP